MKTMSRLAVATLLTLSGLAVVTHSADAESGDPVIAGSGQVGTTLTITSHGAVPGDPATHHYDWLWEGNTDPGPHDQGATHVVTPADVGHRVSVLVEENAVDGDRRPSNEIVAVPAAAAAAAPAARAIALTSVTVPTVKGTAKVGKKLAVRSKGTWAGAPTTYAYRWLRNGKAISKATKSSYKLTKKDQGKRISVRVTAKKSGATAVSATSKRTGKVKKK